MAEKGLGTGLGALFGAAALESDSKDWVYLPISKVEAAVNQPRKTFEQESLYELTESIREHGIIQPLTVRKLSSGYYQIIAGERRWRAAREAGLAEVPVRIIEADDRKAMEIALIENLQREDLNPIEEARGYKALIEEYGLTQDEAAVRVGKSRPVISNGLRLLTLPKELLDELGKGTLSAGHARAILQIKSSENQLIAAKLVISNGLSVRQTESLARRLNAVPKKKTQPTAELVVNYIEEVEKKLTSDLGRKIKIHDGRKKGRLEIEYYGADDLEMLIEALDRLKLKEAKK